MIAKIEKARWTPPLKALQHSGVNKHGWIILGTGRDSTTWDIVKWHSFDHRGATLETLVIENNGKIKEIYSFDEGETFTFDLD